VESEALVWTIAPARVMDGLASRNLAGVSGNDNVMEGCAGTGDTMSFELIAILVVGLITLARRPRL
jgi:hypothetical protein